MPFGSCIRILNINMFHVLAFYHKSSHIRRIKSHNLNDSRLVLQLSLPKPGVQSKMKMQLEQRRQAVLQPHLSDQRFISYLGATYIRRLAVIVIFPSQLHSIYNHDMLEFKTVESKIYFDQINYLILHVLIKWHGLSALDFLDIYFFLSSKCIFCATYLDMLRGKYIYTWKRSYACFQFWLQLFLFSTSMPTHTHTYIHACCL